MITWRGFLYLIMLAIMYLVIAYTGFMPLLLVLAVMAVLPVFSAVQLFISCRLIDIKQYLVPNPVPRKEKMMLQIIFKQRGPFTQGLLDYHVKLTGKHGKPRYIHRKTAILSGKIGEKRIAMLCPHHGHYKVGLSRVWARDLLGLFMMPVRMKWTLKKMQPLLTVWPQPESLDQLDELASFLKLQPQQISPRYGDEVDAVANLRGWQPGDSMKRVHWKLTARLNETMIKEYEKPLQQETLLLFDLDRIRFTRMTELQYLDYFKDYAAELARQAVRSGSRLHSVWYPDSGREAVEIEDETQLSLIQWQLTDLSYASQWPVSLILKEERQQIQAVFTLFFMTNRLNTETADALTALSDDEYRVCLIFVPEHQEHRPSPSLVSYLQQHHIETIMLPQWLAEKTRSSYQIKSKNRSLFKFRNRQRDAHDLEDADKMRDEHDLEDADRHVADTEKTVSASGSRSVVHSRKSVSTDRSAAYLKQSAPAPVRQSEDKTGRGGDS